MTTLCLPVYLAEEAGWLREAGIRLRYVLVGNADKSVESVAQGACDLAMSGPTMPALAEQAHYNMRVIAAIVDRAAVHGLTANPVIQKIGDVRDFAGLRIAVAPRPSTAYALMAALKKRNRRLLKNMTLIEAPIGQQIEFVRSGQADLYIDQEPYVSAAEAQGYRVVFSAAEMFGPLSFTGLYGRAETLDAKKDMIAALCDATAKACKMIYADPEETEALTIKIFKGLPPPVIRASLTRLRDAQVWPKNLVTTKEAWDNAIGLRRDIGMRFMRNSWSVIDNAFV
ncbi:MAG: ABC transporter substrate-binding protein [Alphaproteobacteria bacterium]|nr:ABC transporter substrate-binding protein [Alphaproteobacteria bacterium]